MTRTQTTIMVAGRDNWSEIQLDAIEKAARGRIVSHREDGRGGMKFFVRPSVYYTKPDRKKILQAVQIIAPNSNWID